MPASEPFASGHSTSPKHKSSDFKLRHYLRRNGRWGDHVWDRDGGGVIDATDADIEIAANDVMDILRQFDNPQDAFSALMLAYWSAIKASYKPEEAARAMEAIKSGQQMLEAFVKEGWQ